MFVFAFVVSVEVELGEVVEATELVEPVVSGAVVCVCVGSGVVVLVEGAVDEEELVDDGVEEDEAKVVPLPGEVVDDGLVEAAELVEPVVSVEAYGLVLVEELAVGLVELLLGLGEVVESGVAVEVELLVLLLDGDDVLLLVLP